MEALETVPEPPELAGDLLDAWLADREIMRLRRRAGSPDHRVAVACSKGMLGWVEFRRRIRREAPVGNDPRVLDFLAVVRTALADLDRAAEAQRQALDDLRAEVAELLGGVVPKTPIPELPGVSAHVDRAIAMHLASLGRGS